MSVSAFTGSVSCIARLIQEFTPNKHLEVTCCYRKSTGGWVDSKQMWGGRQRGRRWVSVITKKSLGKKFTKIAEAFWGLLTLQLSLKRSPDDVLPGAVIELRLRDGDRSSLKLKRVIFRVEVLDAEVICFHRH